MIRAALAALLGILAVVSPVAGADASPVSAFHVVASTRAIVATGWRVSIQVRPASVAPVTGTFAWAGGYLGDGTFVQSGIGQAAPGLPEPAVFVWHQVAGSAPTWFPLVGAKAGDWISFETTLAAGVWTYRASTGGGVYWQLFRAPGPPLELLEADAEYWMPSWGPIPATAMRGLQVRIDGRWTDPHLTFAPSEPICGSAEVVATAGVNLVFRAARTSRPCYEVIS